MSHLSGVSFRSLWLAAAAATATALTAMAGWSDVPTAQQLISMIVASVLTGIVTGVLAPFKKSHETQRQAILGQLCALGF